MFSQLKDLRLVGIYRALRSRRVLESRKSSSTTSDSEKSDDLFGDGVIVGCFDSKENDSGYELTKHAKDLDLKTQGKLVHLLNISGGLVKKGDSKLFYDLSPDHTHVAVVGLGPRKESIPTNQVVMEDIEIATENVREAAAVGTKQLQRARIRNILIEDFENAEACAEGSTLSLFSYDALKGPKKRSKIPSIDLISSSPHLKQWEKGCVLGSAQNFARELMETPSNHMTPTMFVDTVSDRIGQLKSDAVQVIPRPLSWIESKKMGAFLSIARGSAEVPWLLEVRLNFPEGEEKSDKNKPVVLVGKGVTFDTGGISIKPSGGMGLMRGDMGGGACVVSTLLALAQLGCKKSVVALVPLSENMPSGNAVKPGDVVTAMNGKTIEVDNTDAEGRLLLADALCYAHSFNPQTIVNMATLTGAIDVALGSGAAGVFTNSTSLWEQLHKAGQVSGDRLWRMPLYNQYSKQIKSHLADISNVGSRGRSAGSCTAAAFLKEFVEMDNWAHMDIAGVMEAHGENSYLQKGMTGRPTRTIIKFVEDMIL